MRILSWTIRGLGDKKKHAVIKDAPIKSDSDLIILLETKRDEVDRRLLSTFWGSRFKS